MHKLALLLLPALMAAGDARYARLGEFRGEVEVQLGAAEGWMPAERNLPLPESAWVRTGADGRAEIELDDGSAWRLGPDSQGALADYTRLSTGQRVTLIELDHGLAYLTGEPKGRDVLAVGVPGAQVTLTRRGRLRFEAQEQWSAIAVLEGVARFSSPAAEIDLREGQITRVEPANPARFFLYREIPVLELDRWSAARDKALDAPPSAVHARERYGAADLDAAGQWIGTEDLGLVWKPNQQDGFVPFAKGRWRWFGALGYTWVSDEAWGWLPYHYGRWAHRTDIGWVWSPAGSGVFKPGEAYWLRGAKLAGWGPLAPGEPWPVSGVPQQFMEAWITYAAFQPDGAVIDPAGFAARPKEALAAAVFTAALPSPLFPAARLEATRPVVGAGNLRVEPSIEGVSFESAAVPAPASSATPVIIVTAPAADPPSAPPDPVAVPVPVPVAVPIILMSPPATAAAPVKASATPAPPAKTVPAPGAASTPPAAPGASGRGTHSHPPGEPRAPRYQRGEEAIATEALQNLRTGNFGAALRALELWTQNYPYTDFQLDRACYYLQAYSGTNQPAKVVDAGAALLSRETPEQRQRLLALYLVALNIQKLRRPSAAQAAAARTAATELLARSPEYFQAANRPASTTEAQWQKARSDAENTARQAVRSLREH